jgi:hypothetical protein
MVRRCANRRAEVVVVEQREYVRRLLEAYRATPGTAGVVRRPDRLFAAQLHERSVPLETVENALTLAAARRSARPADAPPLGTIRSLAYFSPVIEEATQGRTGILPAPPQQITARHLPTVTRPASPNQQTQRAFRRG